MSFARKKSKPGDEFPKPCFHCCCNCRSCSVRLKRLIIFVFFFCLCGLTFTRWGCCGLWFWHKPTELVHSFLFCSCVYFCLYGPFNCISLHKFSRLLFTLVTDLERRSLKNIKKLQTAIHSICVLWIHSSPRGLTLTWWVCYGLCQRHRPAVVALSFLSILVSVSVFMALSTVFHSIDSLDNSLFSHSVLPVSSLPGWSFQLYVSLWKAIGPFNYISLYDSLLQP